MMSVLIKCDSEHCNQEINPEAHQFAVTAGIGNVSTHQLHYHENCLDPQELQAIIDDVDNTPIDFVLVRLINFPVKDPQG